jgi:hypothetical protein
MSRSEETEKRRVSIVTDSNVLGTSTNGHHAVQILSREGCCDKILHIECCGLSKSSKQMIHLFEAIGGLDEFQRH